MVHVNPVKVGKKERMSFANIYEFFDMPYLIDILKKSFVWFIN